MKLGLIVEDDEQEAVLSKLASRIGNQSNCPLDISKNRVRMSKGFGDICKRLQVYVDLLRNVEAEIIIIVVDNERYPLNERLNSLRSKISQVNPPIPVAVAVAVQTIEAWLLADVGALNSTLGTTQISQLPFPSKIKYPKEKFIQIVKQYGNQPVSSSLCSEIADKSDKKVLDNNCKSFQHFHDELKNCLRAQSITT